MHRLGYPVLETCLLVRARLLVGAGGLSWGSLAAHVRFRVVGGSSMVPMFDFGEACVYFLLYTPSKN